MTHNDNGKISLEIRTYVWYYSSKRTFLFGGMPADRTSYFHVHEEDLLWLPYIRPSMRPFIHICPRPIGHWRKLWIPKRVAPITCFVSSGQPDLSAPLVNLVTPTPFRPVGFRFMSVQVADVKPHLRPARSWRVPVLPWSSASSPSGSCPIPNTALARLP